MDINVSNASVSSSCSLKLFKFFQALRMNVFRLKRPKMRRASFCIAVRYELILTSSVQNKKYKGLINNLFKICKNLKNYGVNSESFSVNPYKYGFLVCV